MHPSQRRPSDDELLDAARDVFADVGYRDASVAAIARRGGTTKPTLYAHLGNKESMYQRVVGREMILMQTSLFSVYDTLDVGDVGSAVRVAVTAGMQYAAQHPASFALLMSANDPGSPTADMINAVYREFAVRIAQLIDQTLAARNDSARTPVPGAVTRTVATMVVATGLEAARYALLVEGMEPVDATDVVSRFICAGIESVTDPDPQLPTR
ncbi:hypothetical protein ASG84_12515 [Rhodococcus sp. Leaf278]|uniref:TetR/AcrR family transcriptional regulator n=1 Tax=Rhodococcus sp. Leaf278 TaxID=1736319 RepID=UPI0007157F01|nr:TetR/AcrR family transcriptional regulator [Rhodococcus sp. Leaf278]KQU45066.1 hypothetical protein ASG84_12515 [Rhodococcus sp. Leaf278]